MSREQETVTVHVLRSEFQSMADELKRAIHVILKQELSVSTFPRFHQSSMSTLRTSLDSASVTGSVVPMPRFSPRSASPSASMALLASPNTSSNVAFLASTDTAVSFALRKSTDSHIDTHHCMGSASVGPIVNPTFRPRASTWMKRRKEEIRRKRQSKRTRPGNLPSPNFVESNQISSNSRSRWNRHHDSSYRQLHRLKDNISSMPDLIEHDLNDDNDDGKALVSRRLPVAVGLTGNARKSKHSAWDDSSSDSSDGLDGRPVRALSRLPSCVRNEILEYITCMAVVLNAISIGVETQYMAIMWTDQLPYYLYKVDMCFFVYFAVEIGLRFCSEGFFAFFCSSQRGVHGGWLWNSFDLCVTLLQAIELFRGVADTAQELSSLRLVRLVRIVRVLRSISELRMLVVSIVHALKSLFWVMLLLLTMVYMVAVFLTLEVTNFKIRRSTQELDKLDVEQRKSYDDMLDWFGSLDRSMLSLYAMVAEGAHWMELMGPLAEHISPWMRLVFFVFSAIAIFAVLNSVTGVFVESVVSSAVEDKKLLISRQMRKLFRRAGGDDSGDITLEEFEMQVESPEIQAALLEVDVDPEDARELFRLLDTDNSGSIDVRELVYGSYRLMGQAKAIDLATLMFELNSFVSSHQSHVQYVEERLSSFDTALSHRPQNAGC